MMFSYHHATLVKIIDGDTVDLSIDMGFKIQTVQRFRLAGINSPERGHIGWAEATLHLAELLANGISRIQTYKSDSFGRWLVDIWIKVDGGELLINKIMIVEGFAVEYTK